VSRQFILVDMNWLTLPILLWALITSFFFATISKSRTNGVPVWKSSPLALLACSDPNNQMVSMREIKRQARKTHVQLQFDGTKWHLASAV
jgi:hypothetical protein